ncbi:MAG TPA: NTP transferase domain-containing protein, partial [Rhizomicrobium sp.]|nr:NTP transferase domain-containing protein [Rhizomicrobium sp.]
MKSAKPKVMHEVAHLPMLGHVINAMKGAGISRIVVVTAPAHDEVRAFAATLGAESVVQDKQLGTGHAAACAAPLLKGFDGVLVVSYGDMPLVTAQTFEDSFAAREAMGMAIVAFHSESKAYGRVIVNDGQLYRIVEYKDADEHQRAVKLCNAGIMAADAKSFFQWAAKLENKNTQSEYYLTDIPTFAREDGVNCAVVEAAERDMMGVNSRAELAACEAVMQQRLRAKFLNDGVGMTAPDTVHLSYDTVLEPDCHIGQFVVFGPGVTVRSGVQIKAFSHLEGAVVGKGALVGPYARLRPGAVLEDDVHIGNFVEVKKATIEKGAKANHLTYIGDARVGAGANVG